jgi:hypothetical protein
MGLLGMLLIVRPPAIFTPLGEAAPWLGVPPDEASGSHTTQGPRWVGVGMQLGELAHTYQSASSSIPFSCARSNAFALANALRPPQGFYYLAQGTWKGCLQLQPYSPRSSSHQRVDRTVFDWPSSVSSVRKLQESPLNAQFLTARAVLTEAD